jgi:tetratricopeptide (TPR) repeat protein
VNRIILLERAKNLSIVERQYDKALEIISKLLESDRKDIDALRLKGNILDLMGSDPIQDVTETSGAMDNFEKARECYEEILRIDPQNTLALIDMGDYWEQMGDYEIALKFYDKAIELLKKGHFYISYEDEMEEAFSSRSELIKIIRNIPSD